MKLHRLRFHLRTRLHFAVRWVRRHVPDRLLVTAAIAFTLLLIGTVGYRTIEGDHWSYFDGFYMTAITLTTIGYGEMHELSWQGRAFTVGLAYSGIFVLAYFASELVRVVVTGELRIAIGRQWVDDQLANLSGHTIVCGFGRMGRIVCGELERQKKRFVVLDTYPNHIASFPYKYGLPVHGDATVDDVLRKAGVDRAGALITAVGSDSANLYITLTARLMNSKLLIVARAEEEEAETKLRKVGANKVISPYLAGAHRAVQAVFHPSVLHFMEMAARPEFLDLQIEEIRIAESSTLVGQTLKSSRLHDDIGVIVVGLQKPDGELIYAPASHAVLTANAVMLALGQKKQLDRLEQLAKPRE